MVQGERFRTCVFFRPSLSLSLSEEFGPPRRWPNSYVLDPPQLIRAEIGSITPAA